MNNQLYCSVIALCILLLNAASVSGASTQLRSTPVPALYDLFGINFNWWVRGDIYNNIKWPAAAAGATTNNPYNNTYLHKFLKGIGAPVTRFPGGTTSTYWNVTSSKFVDTSSPVCQTIASNATYTVKCTNYNNAQTANAQFGGPSAMTLQAFGEQMAASGLEWMYVTNLYTTPVEDIIAAIHSLCTPGNPACPTYLELGNEYYLANFYPTTLMPSSAVYMDLCEKIYNETSHYFPGRIAGLTSYSGYVSLNYQGNSQVAWNYGLFGRSGIAYDHLTIHIYTLQASNFKSNPAWAWYTMMLAWPESSIRVTYDRYITQFPNNVKLWLTEFNYNAALSTSGTDAASLFAANQRWQPSHGLFVAGFYLSMLQYPDVFTKALLFESVRDGYLSSFLIDETGTYVYAPGQIHTHFAHIMNNTDTFAGLNFDGVENIPSLAWYNSFNKPMSALQGAVFYMKDNKGLIYAILNRINSSITVNLTESAAYKSVTSYNYPGDATISTLYYPFDIENQQYPVEGPIPVTTVPRTNTDGVYQATFAPLSLTILHFHTDAIYVPTPEPTVPPTPVPTQSPVEVCQSTVRFEQQQQTMSPFSAQWLVRIHTSSSPLYSPKIRVSPAPSSLWNLVPVPGEPNVYTIPEYQLENGVVPADRSCITFGYTTSGGLTPVDITLANDACTPITEGCSATVTNQLVSEWTYNGVLFQQYTVKVENTGVKTVASEKIEFSFDSQTTLYQYWNLAPESGSVTAFNVNTGSIKAGKSNGNGGYQVTTQNGTPGQTYVTLSSTTPVCLV
jgi:hypothetical protein